MEKVVQISTILLRDIQLTHAQRYLGATVKMGFSQTKK
jgi:hypothetical protein